MVADEVTAVSPAETRESPLVPDQAGAAPQGAAGGGERAGRERDRRGSCHQLSLAPGMGRRQQGESGTTEREMRPQQMPGRSIRPRGGHEPSAHLGAVHRDPEPETLILKVRHYRCLESSAHPGRPRPLGAYGGHRSPLLSPVPPPARLAPHLPRLGGGTVGATQSATLTRIQSVSPASNATRGGVRPGGGEANRPESRQTKGRGTDPSAQRHGALLFPPVGGTGHA